MVKIDYILSRRDEYDDIQRRVLDVLEKHPEELFMMTTDDLKRLQAWLSKPSAPKPPRVFRRYCTIDTLKWVLKTLESRGKIRSIELNGRRYYGCFEAIERAKAAEKRAAEEVAKELRNSIKIVRIVREE